MKVSVQLLRALSSPAAVFWMLNVFQDNLCLIKILVNTYDTKFKYNVYFSFGILSRYRETQSVRNEPLLGTTAVLKVRVTAFLRCAQ